MAVLDLSRLSRIYTPTPGELIEPEYLYLIEKDAATLTGTLPALRYYRDYYDGEQPLVFTTDEFKRAFGLQFGQFRSNWMEVVVDAVEERLDLERIVFRTLEGSELDSQSRQIWQTFLNNEWETLQNDVYSTALIEERSFVLVWPDDELGARVDFQSPQNVLVTYDEGDDSRRIVRAIKRWYVPDTGELRLTLYMPDFIYKFHIPPRGVLQSNEDAAKDRDTGFQRRIIPNEPWPLPNPLGEVPIVEFPNRKDKSEIYNAIPLQDALNKTIVDMLVAGEFAAHKQKYIVSSNQEPAGGWKSMPGYTWHIQPEMDIDGRPLQTQVGTLDSTDPSTYVTIIETFLQQIAHTTRTPMHYFLSTSKGGQRGDAPSGESLRVTESGLLKKVEKLQEKWGLRWVRLARLIGRAIQVNDLPITADQTWKHPQAHYLGALLDEGMTMVNQLGLPEEHAWRHIGLTEEQIKDFRELLDAREAEEEAKNLRTMEAQAKISAASKPSPSSPSL